MAETVYILCALMSIGCAALLRGYRRSRSRLLLWSSLSFCAFTVNNVLLFVDTVLLPELDFHGAFWRTIVGAVAGSLLLFGLIWNQD